MSGGGHVSEFVSDRLRLCALATAARALSLCLARFQREMRFKVEELDVQFPYPRIYP